MDDLYDKDLYAWSQRQAAVLRSLAQRRDLPNELDLEHVAEEIEDVGGSQLSSVKSFLGLIFVHLMKAASSPSALPGDHWIDEVMRFQIEMRDRFTPSMRQLIDLDAIWHRARRDASSSLGLYGEALSPHLPETCPFKIDELVDDAIDLRQAFTRLNIPLPDQRG